MRFARALSHASIKTRVTVGVTLSFIAALVLVSGAQVYYVKNQMKKVLADQQLSLASRIADDIDQKMALNLQALVAASRMISAEKVGDVAALERILSERSTLRLLFNDLFVISAAGRSVVDLPALGRRGLDVSAQENFRVTVATREPYISRPFLGRALRQPVVTMSVPIFNARGELAAVLTGSLNLLKPNFLGKIGEMKVGKTGSLAILTRERVIVMSSDKDRIMTEGPPRGVSPYFDHATAGEEGSEESTNSRGLHAIFSYSQLENVPWVLVAALPVDEAYAPVAKAQNQILQVTLLLALILAPAVWYAARRSLAPLLVLHNTIREVRDNPLAITEVPVTRQNEIGDLAADFNEMLREWSIAAAFTDAGSAKSSTENTAGAEHGAGSGGYRQGKQGRRRLYRSYPLIRSRNTNL
jgi:HAMP domain-containing protein